MNTTDYEQALYFGAESVGPGVYSVGTTPKNYHLYYLAPTDVSWAGKGFFFSFDMANLYDPNNADNDPNIAVFLHNVEVAKMAPPAP